MVIYCYVKKEIYINLCFVDVIKIHPTLVRLCKALTNRECYLPLVNPRVCTISIASLNY